MQQPLAYAAVFRAGIRLPTDLLWNESNNARIGRSGDSLRME